MSQYLNRYFSAVTSSNWKDGDYEEIVYCYGVKDGNLEVHTKNNTHHKLPITSIKKVLSPPNPVISFPIGSTVEYVYDYHWKDGEYTTFGVVTAHDSFYNDVTYTIKNYKDGMIKSYSASNVKRIATLSTPKYSLNQRVGVVTVFAANQFTDDIVENATIVAINPEFTKVTYTVKLDSGSTINVEEYAIRKPVPPPKTQKQYLQDEEMRLMQQLEAVRQRMMRY